MKCRVLPAVLGALASLFVAGCDIAADERIGATPINDVDGNNLDPSDPDNVAFYFYADRPVVGLRFLCTPTAGVPISGKSNADGRIVCPRTSIAAFYLGSPGQMKLGQVNLAMFGKANTADARNYVTITPATLEGTVADSGNNRVVNLFNLLVTLEGPPSSGRDVLRITEAVDLAFSSHASALDLDDTPSVFAFELEQVATAIEAISTDQELRYSGAAMTIDAAADLADAAILRARSGMYRTATTMYDSDATGKILFTGGLSMSVARAGHTSGLATYMIVDSRTAPATVYADIAGLDDSRVTVSGQFVHGPADSLGLVFLGPGSDDLLVTGNLVNDWLFGDLQDLLDGNNDWVPDNYTINSDHLGQFSFNAGEFTAGTYMYPLVQNTPTIDDSLLPSAYLPLTLGLKFKGYPDGNRVTDAQVASSSYLASQPERNLFIRILPSGDIVSDVDFDCADIVESGGQIHDTDGNTPEFYIGHVGNVFMDGPEGAETAYITLLLSIFEPSHPEYGFTLGTLALGKDDLGSVVYDVANEELRSKSCNPEDDPCNVPVEWFNDVKYFREVSKPVLEGNYNDTQADVAFRTNSYYGKVVLATPVCIVP